MQDRYLFRAKRTDNSEWVEGFLFQLCYDSTFCWCIGNEPLSPNDYSELYGFNREWFYIDESTICQCTGLKDKNGNLIWENDIVKPFADLKGIVRFGERDYSREFGFNIEWMSKSCYRRDILYWAEKCKVIGSVIDNPELLEQEG